jgi:tetratricopeptide (TPR) repeat protein
MADASPRSDAHTLALAGFDAFLVKGDVEKARLFFVSALKKDQGEPYALMGEWVLARHDGHPERALQRALWLLERQGRHPLASLAARYVGDLAGNATPLDDLILSEGQKALQKELAPDAALLLRGAMAGILQDRQDEKGAELLRAMGTPEEVTVLGPFSPFSVLDFDQKTPPEQSFDVGPTGSPFGALTPRTLRFRDGRWSLSGESPIGDMYVFAVDVEAEESGHYVLRTAAGASYKTYLDGKLVDERRAFEHATSTVTAKGVRLARGHHRIVLKLSKEDRSPTATVSLFPVDGSPARLKLSAAQGPAPLFASMSFEKAKGIFPRAVDLRDALVPEVGLGLATYLALRDGMGRDRDGSALLLTELGTLPQAPAWLSLRAELSLMDHSVPGKISHGRATRDLEAALELDKTDVPALLTRASLALEESRTAAAAERVKEARGAYSPPGFPVLMLQARVGLALGTDAQADELAKEALVVQPGLCEATELRYDLAMRHAAVAEADELVRGLSSCPPSRWRPAEHARLRGRLPEAAERYQALLSAEPARVELRMSLVGVLVAQRRFDDALTVLREGQALWPRNPALVKKEGEVLELSGDAKAALAVKERALLLDGADLSLRREVERRKTGKELLADQAVSGKEAIAYYRAHHPEEDAPLAYVLDAAATRVYPDGAMVDRVHIIQKVLDESGIAEAAEVSLPPGAQVLTLHTLKSDGSVLEPESIEGKETLSLPGVTVGDMVEYEYLEAHAPRGPAQPGFTAATFYYQVARTPDNWATYTVVAPKGWHMGTDAHHMNVRAPQGKGDDEVFFHEVRQSPPFLPEPDSPPSANEYLPFVVVGAGDEGEDGLLRMYSDAYFDRGQRTAEVEAFARQAAAGKSGMDAAKAVYAAVMHKVAGHDVGLPQSAASTLAQERGSRLWLLKASLEAVGIPTRVAAVRTFSMDPAPYKYPSETLYPYLCLRAEVPGRPPLWLDTAVRYGPFGALPEAALGGRDVALLAEPGRPLASVKTPPAEARPGRRVDASLTLDETGGLKGQVEETYEGDEAAQLAEGLESVTPAERNQALQGALERYFPGAELTQVKLTVTHEVGAPLKLHYELQAPRFARREGAAQVIVPSVTFPAHLGRRYLQLSARQTDLFLDDTEASTVHVKLNLPKGYTLTAPVKGAQRQTRFGGYSRQEIQSGQTLTVDDNYHLPMQRISPKDYEDFSQFLGELDLLQTRDLTFDVRGANLPPQAPRQDKASDIEAFLGPLR